MDVTNYVLHEFVDGGFVAKRRYEVLFDEDNANPDTHMRIDFDFSARFSTQSECTEALVEMFCSTSLDGTLNPYARQHLIDLVIKTGSPAFVLPLSVVFGHHWLSSSENGTGQQVLANL